MAVARRPFVVVCVLNGGLTYKVKNADSGEVEV
jgi:hypothetical protein